MIGDVEIIQSQKDSQIPKFLEETNYKFEDISLLIKDKASDDILRPQLEKLIDEVFNGENSFKIELPYKHIQDRYILSEAIKVTSRIILARETGDAVSFQFLGEMGAGKSTAVRLVSEMLGILDPECSRIAFRLKDDRDGSDRNGGQLGSLVSPELKVDGAKITGVQYILRELRDLRASGNLKPGSLVTISELQFLTKADLVEGKNLDLEELLTFISDNDLNLIVDTLHSNFRGEIFPLTSYLMNRFESDLVNFWPCNPPAPDIPPELNMRLVDLDRWGRLANPTEDVGTAHFLQAKNDAERLQLFEKVTSLVESGLLPEIFVIRDPQTLEILCVRIPSGFNDFVYVPGGKKYMAVNFNVVLDAWAILKEWEQYELYREQMFSRFPDRRHISEREP